MRRLTLIAARAAALASLAVAPAQAALTPGAKAPNFTTRGAIAGKPFTVTLAEQLKKGPVVLYFFPAAFTSGCSAEARAFAEKIDAFKAAGATVIGMSADPVDVLAKFSAADCAGKFAVATADPALIQAYDVALGRSIPGHGPVSNRTSYVIARDGRIAYAHSEMSPVDHVTNTLAEVKKLKGR